jgi:hypothetical protein
VLRVAKRALKSTLHIRSDVSLSEVMQPTGLGAFPTSFAFKSSTVYKKHPRERNLLFKRYV